MMKHIFAGATLALLLLQGAGASFSGPDIIKRLPDSQPLFPLSKRASGLRSRNLMRKSFYPQGEVVLSYGEDFHESQNNIFVVDITFIAHETLPIVLLEDFEELTSSITCVDDLIIVTFSDRSDVDYIKGVWSSLDKFILVSNHALSGCNPKDEHGAYLVKNTYWNTLLSTIEVSVESLPLIDAASRVSVDFGYISRDKFYRTLTKRQTTTEEIADDADDDTLNFHFNNTISLNTDFAPRETLQFSLGGIDNGTWSNETDISITCVDCGVSGELVVRGHFDQDILPTEIEWAWVEAEATEAIETKLQLEFFVDLPAIDKELTINLVPEITVLPFSAGGIFTIGPTFEYNLIVGLSFNAAKFNFTYGVEVDVPLNSIARFDLDNNNSSFSRGWNQTKVTEIPFTINELSGNLDLNVNVTAQPIIGFKVDFAMGTAQAGPTLGFEAPKFMLSAKQLERVNSECNTPSSRDGVYDTAFQFSANWELSATASLGAELDLPDPFGSIEGSISLPLFTFLGTPALTCMALDDSSNGTGELKVAKDVDPDSGSKKSIQRASWMLAFLVIVATVSTTL